MTQKAVNIVDPSSIVLKLHSRCKLLNMKDLQKFIDNNGEFVFVRRNMFRFNRSNLNKCPFAETRLYLLNSENLKTVIDKVVLLIDDSINFEHAFLSASYQVGRVRANLISHGSFYPRFEGQSGHGANYSSLLSKIKSYLHGISYRLGI